MYEVYEVEGGYGYKVDNGTTRVRQEHNPFRLGRVPMTQEEAEYFASCIDTGEPIDYEIEQPPEMPPQPTPEPNEVEVMQARLSDVESLLIEILFGGA